MGIIERRRIELADQEQQVHYASSTFSHGAKFPRERPSDKCAQLATFIGANKQQNIKERIGNINKMRVIALGESAFWLLVVVVNRESESL